MKSPNNLKYHFFFIITAFFAVVLRLYYYMGPSGADDVIYYSVVEKLLLNVDVSTAIISSKHWGVRLGLIFPVWGFMKLFGVSEVSSYLFPMITSTGTLILIYIAGLRFFNPAIALISSLCFAILPQDVYLSTVMYPDGPVVFFSTLFIYLFYRVALNDSVSIKESLIAGLVLGIGCYVRETAVLMLVALPILFFRAPNKRNYCKSVCYVLAGLSIAIGLEMIFLWVITGDPLMRFKILLGETKILAPRGVASWGPNYSNIKSTYNKYLFEPFIVIFATYWISPMMILISIGIPILIMIRRNGKKLLSSWNGHFLWLFILTFGILAYYTYGPIYGLAVPLKRSVRYYHVITPLASILSGVVLYELLIQKGLRRWTGYLLIVFYIGASFICLGSIINKNAHGIELIEEFIEQNPAENYIMPMMLKKTLQLMDGPDFPLEKVMTYQYLNKARKNDKLIADLLTNVRKVDSKQYVFVIPKLHEIQIFYLRQINWPMDKLDLVKVMSTSPGFSCRFLKFNDYIYNLTPNLLKSKICYTTDIYVYQLK